MTPAGNTGPDLHWPEALLSSVSQLPTHSRLYLALSGGLDSVLLLHCAARVFPGTLSAIHVNHQLQPNAGDTERFCRDLCRALEVSFQAIHADVQASCSGDAARTGGLEASARSARYRAFEACLGPGDLLLMAHHADDQAETVLFRLIRGTGVAGLAGMPVSRTVGKGALYRPFLNFSRHELQAFARKLGIDWVEDPSNQDQRFDRNFLRHSIIPALRQRWPYLNRRLAASARACRENDELAHSLARIHFDRCRTRDDGLDLTALAGLSAVEQKNLIRWWVSQQRYLPPDMANWPGLLSDFLESGEDRQPEYRGANYLLRRHQNTLYIVPDTGFSPDAPVTLSANRETVWGNWRVYLRNISGSPDGSPTFYVHAREGGERIRIRPGGPSRLLKKWFQEQGVPAWERGRIPLVTRSEDDHSELVAVGDLWVSDSYHREAPASGWRLILERDSD
jgi:tRNA(Ile)-lysidine synthase